MSKFRIAMAVAVLASLSASPALARGLGLGGVIGGVRSVLAHVLPLGVHRGHHTARESHIQTEGHIQTAALEPQGTPDVALGPSARGQIVAAAALAGWHDGRASSGWWRHGDGSYGWVGPLFWPFAFDDIYDYAVFGDGAGFWGYGYRDIYAGIFAPYGQEDLASYRLDSSSGRRQRRNVSLQELCGEAVNEIAGRTMEQIQQAIQPNETQRAALGELANASSQAAYIIRASCPAQPALTAPDRLTAMQDRVEAMITATSLLRAPFANLYDLLDDEQKARLNARAASRKSSGAGCDAEASAGLQWPVSEIDARLHPDHAQRVALETVQNTSARAADILNRACPAAEPPTPSARFSAANRRLIAMLQAVRQVKAVLEDCLATLSDGQKAQLEAIGPRRTS
jgi:LTXXQ motif family protein